ncbi:MAG: PDZ domain-containing protein, partial [Planctomycetota bacterium]
MNLAVLGIAALAALAPPQETQWPFGAAGAKRDLYHAGFLGFKASDAIEGEPRSDGASGKRSVQTAPDDGRDFGPEVLRVEMLLPGGPAEEAGLLVGDEVLGLGRKNFKEGCFEPLAKALAKALKSKEPATIELKVRREGEKGTETVEIEVESLGKVFSKPTSPEARAVVGQRALAWLAERQGTGGGFKQTLSGVNGAVIQTCVAGLAWIAGGSNLESGDYAENLTTAVSFVRNNLDNMGGRSPSEGGANWNQSNWGWA